jgi:hypothetical protein
MDENQKELSLVIEKSKNAQTMAVTGAWGGPSPDGSNIIAHFYVESHALPNIINIKADELGKFDPNKGEQIMRGDLTREIQAVIVMAPEVAVSVGKWLEENGRMLLESRDKGFPY